MKVSWWLNIFGLAVGIAAALLMYYFPLRVQIYTETGSGVFTWTNQPTEKGKRIGKRQAFLAKAAPITLTLSFTLQFSAALLSWIPS